MGFFEDPTGIGTAVGGVTSLAKGILDKIFPDADAASKAQAALELADLTARTAAITAEAQSADKWTSRARPSFMYVMYLFLLSAIPMGVLFFFRPDAAQGVCAGMKLWFDALPGEMYALFGAGYLGYAVTRSGDKKAQLQAWRWGR